MPSKKNGRGDFLKPRNPLHDAPIMKKSHGHTKGRQSQNFFREIQHELDAEGIELKDEQSESDDCALVTTLLRKTIPSAPSVENEVCLTA